MKKTILIGLAAAAVLATGLQAADAVKLTKEQLSKIQTNTPLFKNKNISIIKGYDRPEIGIIQVETVFKTPRGQSVIPAFIDKDTNVVYVGTAYKPNGEKLSMPIEKEIVDNGVAFTYGSGKKGELYLFTDPECPYCKRLETQLGKKLDEYKIHVVLFPLNFHQHAKPMVQWILRGKTEAEKAERMKKVMNGSEEWKKDLGFTSKNYKDDYKAYMNVLNSDEMVLSKDAKSQIEKDTKRFFKDEKELKDFRAYLKKSAKSFREVGATGTPTLMNGDFKKVNPSTL